VRPLSRVSALFLRTARRLYGWGGISSTAQRDALPFVGVYVSHPTFSLWRRRRAEWLGQYERVFDVHRYIKPMNGYS
jgi:hypothetical protein